MMHFAISPAVSPESKAMANITENNLKEHGIEYESAISGSCATDATANKHLPKGIIEGVREYLSDFTWSLVNHDLEKFLEHERSEVMKRHDFSEIVDEDSWCLLPPRSAFRNDEYPDDDDDALRSTVSNQIKECREIAKGIVRLREASEHDWTHYLRVHFFRRSEGTKRTRETVE
jgi:hypothetical protein